MLADIISVGSEYLTGMVEEKNAPYLAGRLAELNVDLRRRSVIGDDPKEFRAILEESIRICDLLVVTGISERRESASYHEIIAELFSGRCLYSEEVFHFILDYVKAQHLNISQKQIHDLAILPGNAAALPNHCGITPGYILRQNGKTIIVLPSSPRETEAMFEDDVAGFLFHDLSVNRIQMKIELKPLLSGPYSQEKLKEKLGELMENSNPKVSVARENAKDLICVQAAGPTKGDAQILANMMVSACCQRIGEDLIGNISM